MSNTKEALELYKDYYQCPHCVDAVYHTYSFTHRLFQCKDCNNEFLVPNNIKLNKPKVFKSKSKKEV